MPMERTLAFTSRPSAATSASGSPRAAAAPQSVSARTAPPTPRRPAV
jgi:hypothetical protein